MSKGENLSKPADMSEADFDLIERFVTAFNRVDRYLRDLYRADERMSFGRLVEIHLRKNPHWRDADALRSFKAVRNVIVHERDLPYRYLFVPTRSAVEELERICDHLLNPQRLIPRFRSSVLTVGVGDTAAKLFTLIDQYNCSKFPVYEGELFRGLLTENGITRWLASHSATVGTRLNLDEVVVATILEAEENGRNVDFLAADMSTDNLLHCFATNQALQAVLITQHGNQSEPLLGIATWGDALRLI